MSAFPGLTGDHSSYFHDCTGHSCEFCGVRRENPIILGWKVFLVSTPTAVAEDPGSAQVLYGASLPTQITDQLFTQQTN